MQAEITPPSDQFNDLQGSSPIQSKSTQPQAVNPNTLQNSQQQLQVLGGSSSSSSNAPVDTTWPLALTISLVVIAVVLFAGFVLAIKRALQTTPVEEELEIPQAIAEQKPKPAKKTKKPKKKRRH